MTSGWVLFSSLLRSEAAGAGLEAFSINRLLEVLRRMSKLAMEWGNVEGAPQNRGVSR
jgi:hypothetical protein